MTEDRNSLRDQLFPGIKLNDNVVKLVCWVHKEEIAFDASNLLRCPKCDGPLIDVPCALVSGNTVIVPPDILAGRNRRMR